MKSFLSLFLTLESRKRLRVVMERLHLKFFVRRGIFGTQNIVLGQDGADLRPQLTLMVVMVGGGGHMPLDWTVFACIRKNFCRA